MFTRLSFKAMLRLALSLTLLLSFANAQAGIAVIANKSNKQHAVTKKMVANMYLGKMKHFSNGRSVKPVDQPRGSQLRKKFYRAVLGMSESELNRYWAKRKYSGKGKPPMKLNTDAEILDWVASNPEAIGYIDGKSLNGKVKVLLILP